MWGGCSRLFREGGMADIESDVFGPRPASGQVLAEMLSRSPSTIAPLGEMGKWLQRVLGRNANGAEIALQEEILTLYAKSAPLATWRGSATKGNRPPLVSHPSLTIMGESTLTSIWGALSDETVSSGLVSRFVFVEASAGEDRYESSTGPIPVSVLESLQDMRDLWTTDDVERFPIRWSDEAKAEDKSRFDEWSDSKQGAENHVREVISRMRQNAPRIAGVLALWDNPRAPVVTAAHVAYGWDMATASCQRLLEAYRSGEVISSSTDNSILASYCIERVGIGGIIERRTMQSGLKRRLVVPAGYTYSRTLSSAISDAVDSGLIQLVPEEQRPNGALGRAYLVVQPALE
jgi:hypothetical protein